MRHHPAAVALGAAAAAVDADDVLGLRNDAASPARLAAGRGQVGGQHGQLGVGARGQRRLQPLVEFLGGQPAVARGHPQHLDDTVPVLVRRPQLAKRPQPIGRRRSAAPGARIARLLRVITGSQTRTSRSPWATYCTAVDGTGDRHVPLITLCNPGVRAAAARAAAQVPQDGAARRVVNTGVSGATGGRPAPRLICTRYGGDVRHWRWCGRTVVPGSGDHGRRPPGGSAERDYASVLPAVLNAAMHRRPFVAGWLSRGGGAPLELITNAGPLPEPGAPDRQAQAARLQDRPHARREFAEPSRAIDPSALRDRGDDLDSSVVIESSRIIGPGGVIEPSRVIEPGRPLGSGPAGGTGLIAEPGRAAGSGWRARDDGRHRAEQAVRAEGTAVPVGGSRRADAGQPADRPRPAGLGALPGTPGPAARLGHAAAHRGGGRRLSGPRRRRCSRRAAAGRRAGRPAPVAVRVGPGDAHGQAVRLAGGRRAF